RAPRVSYKRPMHLPRWFFFALTISACGPAAPPGVSTPVVVSTPAAAEGSPGASAEPTREPQPTGPALLAWPVPPLTAAQIAEAKSCDIEKVAERRYPKEMAIDALKDAFATKGA